MKNLKFIILGAALFFTASANAQLRVNINIGTPPLWGPVGYSEAEYYYLPDVESYYDVRASMFIYYSGGQWVHRSYLPSRYGNYDLYGGYKVVMSDYHGNTPYSNFHEYRRRYARGYHGQPQRNIGERPVRSYNNGNRYSNGGGRNNGNGNNGRYNNGRGNGNNKGNKFSNGHDNKGGNNGQGKGNGKKR